MRTLRENQRVSYDLEPDRRGKMAASNLRDASDGTAEAEAPTAAAEEQPEQDEAE